MADDDDIQEECPDGLPPWLATFADLMSLLMCFFVLLLSFSEIEATKFKQMAGAVRMAFGVQRDVEVTETPKGTSVIMRHFSPGKPEPTLLNVVKQMTTIEQPNIDRTSEEEDNEANKTKDQDGLSMQIERTDGASEGPTQSEIQAQQEQMMREMEMLKEQLEQEMKDGLIEVEQSNEKIIIRIREKGSFRPGSTQLDEKFESILGKIADQLTEIEGRIIVSGHSDNVPINTLLYRSNWELSAARAGVVVRYMLNDSYIPPKRVELRALADTVPLVPNNNADNRALNRRIEIAVIKGDEKRTETVDGAIGQDRVDRLPIQ